MAYRLAILSRARNGLLFINKNRVQLNVELEGHRVLCNGMGVRFKTAAAAATKPQNVQSQTNNHNVEVVDQVQDHEDAGSKRLSPAPETRTGMTGLDLSFSQPEIAYSSKTTLELLRSIMVLKLCQFDFLVKYNKQLLDFSRKILGKRLFEALMKATFYGHFVAGEDQPSIKPKVERLNRYGVGAILDYSVEEDIPHNQAVDAEMESCISEADHDEKGRLEIDLCYLKCK
ncbi:proline dehydrogenase 1, mitochondrial-like [Lytechinus pictus]|uniref:proline dehydrogenase 1, mitochondrial-like n=1 Tax=Lytechinus pictus TaxID=7653 RepID=UPI0030B9AFD1